MGTASMASSSEGPFVNLARLNIAKYALQPAVARALFEYIYYHENDVRHVSAGSSLSYSSEEFTYWPMVYVSLLANSGFIRLPSDIPSIYNFRNLDARFLSGA